MFEGKSLIFQSAFQSFMRYLSINLFAYSYKKCVCIRNTKENILFDCKLFFYPSREFFTHIETSPLPFKGWKFRTMLDAYSQWAVRFLKHATPTGTQNHPFYRFSLENPCLCCCTAFGGGHVTTWFQVDKYSSTRPSACEAITLTHCATDKGKRNKQHSLCDNYTLKRLRC